MSDARDHSLRLLEGLVQRGSALREELSAHSGETTLASVRIWQRDCAAAVNELSGGSKAHWLSRAFSDALLVRRTTGGAVLVEAPVAEIVDRILDVLAQAHASLSQTDGASNDPICVPKPIRFDFVHQAALRPVLERALVDSREAVERGEFARALLLSCGAIEALLTDALEARGQSTAHLTFEQRMDEAERLGLIRGACARLTPAARRYRELADSEGQLRAGVDVLERDARVAGQVLRVVIRDLDPGR